MSRKSQKQVTFWLDKEDGDAFQSLCRASGVSASELFRRWILTAIQAQSTEFVVADTKKGQEHTSGVGIAPELLQDLMRRLTTLERTQPKFDEDDLNYIRHELLSGEFGSMRHRLGIVESEVQSLGGNITWNNGAA